MSWVHRQIEVIDQPRNELDKNDPTVMKSHFVFREYSFAMKILLLTACR